MATWKRLKKFIEELNKVGNYKYGVGPTFWNDVDVTGKFPNKSQLREALKKKKK